MKLFKPFNLLSFFGDRTVHVYGSWFHFHDAPSDVSWNTTLIYQSREPQQRHFAASFLTDFPLFSSFIVKNCNLYHELTFTAHRKWRQFFKLLSYFQDHKVVRIPPDGAPLALMQKGRPDTQMAGHWYYWTLLPPTRSVIFHDRAWASVRKLKLKQ